jgi:hypothetical protein
MEPTGWAAEVRRDLGGMSDRNILLPSQASCDSRAALAVSRGSALRPVGDHGQLVEKVPKFLKAVRGNQEIALSPEISQRCGREPLGRRSCPAPRSGLWVREVRPPPHAGNGPGSGPAISLWRRVFRTPPWVSRAISATGRPGQHASVASW